MNMRIKFLLIASTTFLFLSCSNKLVKLENNKSIDARLVGTWVGNEKDKQIEGAEKSWEMNRKSDGTFVLDFKFMIKGRTQKHIETGTWWIEKGKFHEFHDVSGKTDIYKYTVLDENRVKFTSEQMSVEMNSEIYEFIDTRK
jgi:hypothetical protein